VTTNLVIRQLTRGDPANGAEGRSPRGGRAPTVPDSRRVASGTQGETMGVSFPNEPAGYRSARAALLAREVALRRQMEADGAPSKVRLSELFRHSSAT
jgi:hypothetical protein